MLGCLLGSAALLDFGLAPLARGHRTYEGRAAGPLDLPRVPYLDDEKLEKHWEEMARRFKVKLRVGEAAPDVAIQDLETGRQLRLSGLFRGRWTVLLLSSFT